MTSAITDFFRAVEISPLIVLSIATGLVLLCWQFAFMGLDPREPPEVKSSIPFGHLFGMLWYKAEYVTILR
jgi:hypothetical protein